VVTYVFVFGFVVGGGGFVVVVVVVAAVVLLLLLLLLPLLLLDFVGVVRVKCRYHRYHQQPTTF